MILNRQRAVLNTAKARLVSEDGKQFLVAPTTLIVAGVLPGSRGRLFYPAEELSRDPSIWNNVPLTLGHPTDNGRAVSARNPQIRDRFGLGTVRNVRWDDKRLRLRGEAWVDVTRAEKLRPDVINRIKTGGPIEVSTGLFTENEPTPGTYNGQRYDHVARDYRSDHLALLLDSRGACSVNDGCGINVNQQTENVNPQGCNQYGCKAGLGGGEVGGSKGVSISVGKSYRLKVATVDGRRVDVDAKITGYTKSRGDRSMVTYQYKDPVRRKVVTRSLPSGAFKTRVTNQAQASFDDLRKALRRELNTRFGQVEIVDVFPRSVVYSRLSYGPQDSDTVPRLYEVGYTADKRGKVSLSDTGATEVQRVTTYETVSNVGQLVKTLNANPQGCNQYGCKGGSGSSQSLKKWDKPLSPEGKAALDKIHRKIRPLEKRLDQMEGRGLTKSPTFKSLEKKVGALYKEYEATQAKHRSVTNQDGRRVGPSVFNQEEEPDMAHEPLTTNEREQLVTAMVTNCSSFGEDDREWLDGLDDDRLTALAENCAEVKVLNERMAELEEHMATLNKKGAKNKGMPPWLKKKIDEKDGEDEEDGGDDMEENSGCSGKKKMAKNARANDDDEEPDDEDEGCDCDDEQVTDNRNWRDLMTPAEQEVFNEGLAFRTAKREQLIKTITSNKRNRFTKKYLEEQTTNALEAMAELAVEPKGRAAPAYAGLGAPTVRMTANAEPEMEEPLGIPEPDYGAFAAAR